MAFYLHDERGRADSTDDAIFFRQVFQAASCSCVAPGLSTILV